MDKPLYNVSVPENLSVDTYIVQLKATDKDEVSDVSFTYIFIVYLRYVVLLCAVSLFLNRPVL
jgi:glycopeptide antibiotics resistance protein